MRSSLSVRVALFIAVLLLGLVLLVGMVLERQLATAIEDEAVEQAELHAQTLLGSLQSLMLNGNGTLAQEWLDRLQGVKGIEQVAVWRRDGRPAFTDLETVQAVNRYLGQERFSRQPLSPPATRPPPVLFERALAGESVYDVQAHDGLTSVALPIVAEVECLACHGYDAGRLRGVLTLTVSSQTLQKRVSAMQFNLLAGGAILVLLLMLALWFVLRRQVLEPLASLHGAIRAAAAGDREARLPVGRPDELGELARVFNEMQTALRITEGRMRAVMDHVIDGVVMFRENGSIEMINPAVEQLFGYERQALLGRSITKIIPDIYPSHQEQRDGPPQPVLGLAREMSGRRRGGREFPMEVSTGEMGLGDVRYYIAVVRDITRRKARTAALRYQALHDALTDLPNRVLLYDRLQQALREAQREGRSLALLLMDLDRFKEVNDTLGHHVGDKLLQQLARRLTALLRESDTVARLGGDEFSVLLPFADAEEALFIAHKIIAAMEPPVVVEGHALSARLSVGVALYPDHGASASLLMQRADVAMYLAKRTGGGVVVYNKKKDPHSLRQLEISNELQEAIRKGQLRLHYQPKVDLRRHRVIGLEALVRWQHAKHGLLMPDEFVPLAEQTGLIKPLTLWVVRQALRDYQVHLQGRALPVSINLSMLNLADPDFAESLKRVLEEASGPAVQLKLEITETSLMDEPEQVIDAMQRLRELGLSLSIDDFGTGYSSLAYLKQLPVSELKIDKSFGQSLLKDENSEVIVRSTIELAHQLGLEVVAEGVESQESYQRLEQLGCDLVQGFYVARPMPLERFDEWLATQAWRLGRRA